MTFDLNQLISTDEMVTMPAGLVPVLNVLLNPLTTPNECISAVQTFLVSSDYPINPFLDHCLCFYVMRRSGPLEDLTCLEVLKLIALQAVDSFNGSGLIPTPKRRQKFLIS